ncbi:glycosyltransferase family 4 protein [Heliomicrobium modesticaldum]|uniref:glycosyltransferase family 4 protein n=1 Tax=Heliomicrobium modesticaldum TaxID=35701 RepID=UPI00059DB899|nr:glycosyltransferase family 4 protein [Heliomicrobium modesticaldum]
MAFVYPQPAGGVKRYIDTLAKGLCSIGGFELCHFVGEGKAGAIRSLDGKLWEDCVIPEEERRFAAFLEAEKPDVVNFQELQNLGASLIGIAYDRGIPVVVTLHDYWVICPRIFLINHELDYCYGPNGGVNCARCFLPKEAPGGLPEISVFIERHRFIQAMLQKADVIIAVSQANRRRLVQEGIAPERVQTVYPMVEAGAPLPKRSDRQGRLRFGFIGALSPHKGVHVLIEAFRDIPESEATLHLYGEWDRLYVPTLRRLTGEKTNIRFEGAFRHEDLPEIMATLDVLVVPSVCPDSAPLVIQEAYSLGVPVIGARIGGIPELIHEACGMLFEPGDYEQLGDVIKKLLSDRAIVDRWASRLPVVPSVLKVSTEIAAVYKNVAKRRRYPPVIHEKHKALLSAQDRGFLRRQALPLQLERLYAYCREKGLTRPAIFGAGTLGQAAALFFRRRGMPVACFVDNDGSKWGKQCEQFPIIAPHELIDKKDIDFILVASEWEAEILAQLEALGLSVPWYGLFGFVKQPIAGEGQP